MRVSREGRRAGRRRIEIGNAGQNAEPRIERAPDGRVCLCFPDGAVRTYKTEASAVVARSKWRRFGDFKRGNERNVSPPWTTEEERKARDLWGTLPISQYPAHFPGRTYTALASFCQANGIKARPNYGDNAATLAGYRNAKSAAARRWTAEQIAIVMDRSRADAKRLLAGVKTEWHIRALAKQLGLPMQRNVRWSEEHDRDIRTIMRATARLLAAGRTIAALGQRRRDLEKRDRRFAAIKAEAASIAATLPAPIRADIESELLIRALSGDLKLGELHNGLKRALRDVRGAYTLSLDAPIGEDGMTWIDTIESDRAHF